MDSMKMESIVWCLTRPTDYSLRVSREVAVLATSGRIRIAE